MDVAAAPRRVRLHPVAALATVLAAAVSFCLEYALCTWAGSGPQPAILAAILALGMTGRVRRAGVRDVLIGALSVVAVALGIALVGLVFQLNRYLGAAVFTGGMFLSVWLRNFSERVRSLGTLIAFPLVAILIVPGPAPGDRTSLVLRIALAGCAGLLAYGFTAPVARLVAAGGPPARERPAGAQAPPPPGLSVHTRMAAQMAVSIALSFAVGFVLFPTHWGWAVLTAFIVCSGALGRGDALYKAVLRLIGALAGTVAASVFTFTWAPSGVIEAVAIFAILFVGLLLRDVNYAFWAGCTTLVLALLALGGPLTPLALLSVRLEAIFVGALCAVAATSLVFPISTEAVVRRRLADALKALDEVVVHPHHDDAEHALRRARFEHCLAELERVAPPIVWHRRLVRWSSVPEHPAVWIDYARRLHAPAIATEAQRGALRRAIGRSRKAIGEHGKPEATITIGAALDALHAALSESRA